MKATDSTNSELYTFFAIYLNYPPLKNSELNLDFKDFFKLRLRLYGSLDSTTGNVKDIENQIRACESNLFDIIAAVELNHIAEMLLEYKLNTEQAETAKSIHAHLITAANMQLDPNTRKTAVEKAKSSFETLKKLSPKKAIEERIELAKSAGNELHLRELEVEQKRIAEKRLKQQQDEERARQITQQEKEFCELNILREELQGAPQESKKLSQDIPELITQIMLMENNINRQKETYNENLDYIQKVQTNADEYDASRDRARSQGYDVKSYYIKEFLLNDEVKNSAYPDSKDHFIPPSPPIMIEPEQITKSNKEGLIQIKTNLEESRKIVTDLQFFLSKQGTTLKTVEQKIEDLSPRFNKAKQVSDKTQAQSLRLYRELSDQIQQKIQENEQQFSELQSRLGVMPITDTKKIDEIKRALQNLHNAIPSTPALNLIKLELSEICEDLCNLKIKRDDLQKKMSYIKLLAPIYLRDENLAKTQTSIIKIIDLVESQDVNLAIKDGYNKVKDKENTRLTQQLNSYSMFAPKEAREQAQSSFEIKQSL